MEPLASSIHSQTLETARKHSGFVKTPSMEGEGQYLNRAAAYIQERMKKCLSACDAFVPRAPKEPPDKVMESEAIWQRGDIVSKITTSATSH
jgi:hypothetical protein